MDSTLALRRANHHATSLLRLRTLTAIFTTYRYPLISRLSQPTHTSIFRLTILFTYSKIDRPPTLFENPPLETLTLPHRTSSYGPMVCVQRKYGLRTDIWTRVHVIKRGTRLFSRSPPTPWRPDSPMVSGTP
jgi:hypothetical protein